MLEINKIQQFLFVGVGGIGMSALARFFHEQGFLVLGYDRTPSPLTRDLEQEGIRVSYTDDILQDETGAPMLVLENGSRIAVGDKNCTQVVYTPAVPLQSHIMQYLTAQQYDVEKRSSVLGLVTRRMKALCVAGTHGKTTTSTLMAHLFYQSEVGTNAFLGGISENYHTNLLLNKDSNYVVVEADEYDRSFHRLTPYMSVITACDADHLDIYGTAEAYREAFEQYISLVSGAVIIKKGLPLRVQLKPGAKLYTYGVENGEARNEKREMRNENMPDFYADNISVENGKIYFDFHTPGETLEHMKLGVPVWVNIENSVAAMAVAWLNGVSATELRVGLSSFTGVFRRFNIHLQNERVAYVDDYAHHPEEIRATLQSLRRIYPDRQLICAFQPHLFTRTRDFASEFAEVLSQTDELLLLPIYPAREEPIPGVTSEMLKERMSLKACRVVEKTELADTIAARVQQTEQAVVVVTLGAGDIDRLVKDIKCKLEGLS